jgi:hypothetical protein
MRHTLNKTKPATVRDTGMCFAPQEAARKALNE